MLLMHFCLQNPTKCKERQFPDGLVVKVCSATRAETLTQQENRQRVGSEM